MSYFAVKISGILFNRHNSVLMVLIIFVVEIHAHSVRVEICTAFALQIVVTDS